MKKQIQENKKPIDKKIYPDYILLKEIPGCIPGCIFSMGENYIYYISYDPKSIGLEKFTDDEYEYKACEDSMIRFNIYTMKTHTNWFREIDDQYLRDLKIKKLLN